MGFAAGLLAATAVAATAPLAADATRIEYYATVSDPPCQLNFVKSGLGYCDVMVGSGEEVPFAQLINVSFFISQDLTFFEYSITFNCFYVVLFSSVHLLVGFIDM